MSAYIYIILAFSGIGLVFSYMLLLMVKGKKKQRISIIKKRAKLRAVFYTNVKNYQKQKDDMRRAQGRLSYSTVLEVASLEITYENIEKYQQRLNDGFYIGADKTEIETYLAYSRRLLNKRLELVKAS